MSGLGLAAQIVHHITCTRCRMGWYCGGLSEADYEQAPGVRALLDASQADDETGRPRMNTNTQTYRPTVTVGRNTRNPDLIRLELAEDGSEAAFTHQTETWQQIVDQLAALGITATADDDPADDEVDGAPCCLDPGCPGDPCTFPGYADNH